MRSRRISRSIGSDFGEIPSGPPSSVTTVSHDKPVNQLAAAAGESSGGAAGATSGPGATSGLGSSSAGPSNLGGSAEPPLGTESPKTPEGLAHPHDSNKPASSTGSPPANSGLTRHASPQEVYDDLKLRDELLSGAYANAVMIGHGPHEFCFDFITNFYPQSAVSCRVFMSSGHVGRLLDSLKAAWEQLRPRLGGNS